MSVPTETVRRFLDSHGVQYLTVIRSAGHNAADCAAATHILGQQLAKVVVTKLDGRPAMVVLPACSHLRPAALVECAGAITLEPVGPDELGAIFCGGEAGALPPFGTLWDLPVYVSRSLSDNDLFWFTSGSQYEVFRIRFEDFGRLVPHTVGDFSS
jgi:Ala-tRNA(Pro) deacylase